MELVTKKHWVDFNSDDDKVSQRAAESAAENYRKYEARLETFRPRLKERNYAFFKKGLHDARLISFGVGDGLHLDLELGKPVTIKDFYRTSVFVKVMNAEFDAIYELTYKEVSKVVFDFPSESPLWGKNVDDWGYDELSTVDSNTWRHEILFSSGTTALIEFEDFKFRKRKYRGSRH